ncbi:MAG: RIP metalloprotease RseP [Eubacterium sp.]|nr:RIP metalloprotease RseP [Eubacterium sp.]
MNIIAIIIVFGVIVFVHEFGHFIFAKMNRIKVNEFSIGMGPSVASWTKKDTLYSVRALPIGGYCLMEGLGEESKSRNGYNNKSVLARLMVSFAGPLFNFVLAFLLSIIICHFYTIDPPVIDEIMEDSAAEAAGLEAGDEIVSLDGDRIYNYREITLYSMLNAPEKPVDITYRRDGKEYNVSLTRKKDAKSGNFYFGFISRGRVSKGIGEELYYSVLEVRFQIKAAVSSVKMLVTGHGSKDDLMGPVGIGKTMNTIMEEAKEQTKDESAWDQFLTVFLNVINFAVLLSANLGVMNLLPIPALDGGRILFVLIEAISGKKVPPDKEAIVNGIGVALLMLLMIFVFFNDLGNVLHG